VRIEGDQQRFKMALIEQGCTILEEDRQLMDVKLPEKIDVDLILNTVVKTGVVLRKMVPSIQTLEEVFVKRIGGERADI
jgi:hypothetical protein